MKLKTLVTFALAFFALAGCQAHTPVSAVALLDAPVTTPEPVPMIAVFTVDGRPADADWERNEAAAKALEKTVSLSAEAIDLGEAIDFIRDATGVNIVVNWAALELVGIDQESIATVSLKNVSAGQLLGVILDQVGADAFDDDKAGYAIRGGIVHISTLRELKSATLSRLYPLDWYANTRPTLNKQVYGRNDNARRMLGMTTLQNKTVDPATINVEDNNPVFCATCAASHNDRLDVTLSVMTYWEKVEQIRELIQTTVGDPDEWLDEESTLTEIGGQFVIKTTPENHEHIHRLFESMRLERVRQFKQQALEMETLLLLEAAESYRLKQDYRAALKKIDEALRVDPNNLEARALREIVAATLSR